MDRLKYIHNLIPLLFGSSVSGTGFFTVVGFVGDTRVAGFETATFLAAGFWDGTVRSPEVLDDLNPEVLDDLNPDVAGTFNRTVFKDERPESTFEATGFRTEVDAEDLGSKDEGFLAMVEAGWLVGLVTGAFVVVDNEGLTLVDNEETVDTGFRGSTCF